MKKSFIILVAIMILSCEFYSQRFIENKTKYTVWIELHKIPSLKNDVVYLSDSIKSFSTYEKTFRGKNHENFYFLGGPYADNDIDSLVLLFVGQDTTYRKVFFQNDTSKLFNCLIKTSRETCIINESHLKGARLIE